MLKLTPDELVRLAPRLKAYLRQPDPDWRDLVDAAGFLRSDLDVSKSLWGEACVTMGRIEAAIAIAIVSTKDPEHFRTTAGGYFHGMVRKAKAGELQSRPHRSGPCGAAQPNARPRAGGGGGRYQDDRVRSGLDQARSRPTDGAVRRPLHLHRGRRAVLPSDEAVVTVGRLRLDRVLVSSAVTAAMSNGDKDPWGCPIASLPLRGAQPACVASR